MEQNALPSHSQGPITDFGERFRPYKSSFPFYHRLKRLEGLSFKPQLQPTFLTFLALTVTDAKIQIAESKQAGKAGARLTFMSDPEIDEPLRVG